MSEVIVRMEMPWDCTFCPMAHWDCQSELAGCNAVNGKRYAKPTDEFWNKGRPSWCPIIGELPDQHGRLVDADDVNNHVIGYVDLRDCPTIVQATERSEM